MSTLQKLSELEAHKIAILNGYDEEAKKAALDKGKLPETGLNIYSTRIVSLKLVLSLQVKLLLAKVRRLTRLLTA